MRVLLCIGCVGLLSATVLAENFKDPDLYARLGTFRNSSAGAIEKAYFQSMVRVRHPDPAIEKSQQARVREAFEILGRARPRKIYDFFSSYANWQAERAQNNLPLPVVTEYDPMRALGLEQAAENDEILRAFVTQVSRPLGSETLNQVREAFAILAYPPTRDMFFSGLHEADPSNGETSREWRKQRWNQLLALIPPSALYALKTAEHNYRHSDRNFENDLALSEELEKNLPEIKRTLARARELGLRERSMPRQAARYATPRAFQLVDTALSPEDIRQAYELLPEHLKSYFEKAEKRMKQLLNEAQGMDEKLRMLIRFSENITGLESFWVAQEAARLFPQLKKEIKKVEMRVIFATNFEEFRIAGTLALLQRELYEQGRPDLANILEDRARAAARIVGRDGELPVEKPVYKYVLKLRKSAKQIAKEKGYQSRCNFGDIASPGEYGSWDEGD